jgi:hypothetical protein
VLCDDSTASCRTASSTSSWCRTVVRRGWFPPFLSFRPRGKPMIGSGCAADRNLRWAAQ